MAIETKNQALSQEAVRGYGTAIGRDLLQSRDLIPQDAGGVRVGRSEIFIDKPISLDSQDLSVKAHLKQDGRFNTVEIVVSEGMSSIRWSETGFGGPTVLRAENDEEALQTAIGIRNMASAAPVLGDQAKKYRKYQ